MNLKLVDLESKHLARILIEICKTIKQYGFPKFIRSDNEACFTSRLMRVSYQLLGIKPQRIDVASPWQNGRIERFFIPEVWLRQRDRKPDKAVLETTWDGLLTGYYFPD
ncbi:MAG: hypothetical protein MJK04_09230 [Psychrosphaera sp.]|nr:hypothetical protein [Psychrosphaera sp.]